MLNFCQMLIQSNKTVEHITIIDQNSTQVMILFDKCLFRVIKTTYSCVVELTHINCRTNSAPASIDKLEQLQQAALKVIDLFVITDCINRMITMRDCLAFKNKVIICFYDLVSLLQFDPINRNSLMQPRVGRLRDSTPSRDSENFGHKNRGFFHNPQSSI